MKINRSAMEKRRRRRANDQYWYSEAIMGTFDSRMWKWLIKSWNEGARRGHKCIEIEDSEDERAG